MAHDESRLPRRKLYQKDACRMYGCQIPPKLLPQRGGDVGPTAVEHGAVPAAPVDHGLAKPCRGHDEGTCVAAGHDDTDIAGQYDGRAGALAQLPTMVHEGLARLAHESSNMECIFQEFRSPKVAMSRPPLLQWGIPPTHLNPSSSRCLPWGIWGSSSCCRAGTVQFTPHQRQCSRDEGYGVIAAAVNEGALADERGCVGELLLPLWRGLG